jgi:hypothetical protein
MSSILIQGGTVVNACSHYVRLSGSDSHSHMQALAR